MYRKESTLCQRNSMEAGKGEWASYTLKLAYEDTRFFFFGKCDCETEDEYSCIRWMGKVSRREDEEQCDFLFVYLPPSISGMVWPSPGMMQIEGAFIAPQTQIKYQTKLVLSLTVDSNVNGWMLFEASSQEPKVIGRISKGNWKSNGCISFDVKFPPKGVVPNSWTKPTNIGAIFKIDGKIERQSSTSIGVFTATVESKESITNLQKDELSSIPLGGSRHIIKLDTSIDKSFRSDSNDKQ